MKYLLLWAIALLAFTSCKKDEPALPISMDIMEATYNYDFDDIEPEAFPVFDDYVKAYVHTMDPAEYDCGDTYRLDRFHLVLVIHDEAAGNVPATFVFRPAGSSFTTGQAVPIASPAADGGNWYRQRDAALSRRMVAALQTSRSRFAPYAEGGTDFLVIRYDREWLRQLTRASRTRWAAFFVHEGFHLFAQRAMTRPANSQGGLRFNLPEDYPADPESFSLIAAGVQLNENLVYNEGPTDWDRTLAMQYVLLDRLRAADTTGQNYIDEYYLSYAWLEGGAEFIEQKITLGSGIYRLDDAATREQISYDFFQRTIRRTISMGTTTVTVNGVPRETRYQQVGDRTFYQIGAATFRILEGLGEDPMAQMQRGLNPYELLDDYVRANNVVIDEAEALADIKALIDWEESLELMEDYIAVFE